jgi:Cu-Zn family superoxide dismutase
MKAIAVFEKKTGSKVYGTVIFKENDNKNNIEICVDIHGLKKNGIHGFHVHEYGDLSDGCESMCMHFNPYHKNHGGIDSKDRHVGDLGNLHADIEGNAKYKFTDNIIKLNGTKSNIIGRGLIIHADPDDCGKGTNSASLVNGNAGKRIACAVIGYANSQK